LQVELLTPFAAQTSRQAARPTSLSKPQSDTQLDVLVPFAMQTRAQAASP